MKTFSKPNLVHPVAGWQKTESALIIPINDDSETIKSDAVNEGSPNDCHSFVIRRFFRDLEGRLDSQPCKYEVMSLTSGSLLYFISEQTEFFVKNAGCIHTPKILELVLGNSEGVKFMAEFGHSGFCNKIDIFQNKRKLGSVSKRFSLFPHRIHYSGRSYKGSELVKVFSKNCIKNGFLCLKNGSKFEIQFGNTNRTKGGVVSKEAGHFYTISLSEATGDKELIFLIATIVLLDLQSHSGIDWSSCILQFLASICCYLIVFVIVIGLFFVLIIQK